MRMFIICATDGQNLRATIDRYKLRNTHPSHFTAVKKTFKIAFIEMYLVILSTDTRDICHGLILTLYLVVCGLRLNIHVMMLKLLV